MFEVKTHNITSDNVVTVTRIKEDRYIIESLLFNEPGGAGIKDIIKNVEFFTTGAEFSEPLILSKSRVAGRLKKLENLGFVYHKSTATQFLWFVNKINSNNVITIRDEATNPPQNVVIEPARDFKNVEVNKETVIECITITDGDVLPFNNTIVTKVVAPKTPQQLALQQAIINSKLNVIEHVKIVKDTSVFYFVRYKLSRADGQVAYDSKCISMSQQIKSDKDLETLKDLVIKLVKTNQKVCKIDIIYLSKT